MANDISKLIDLEGLSTYKGLSDSAYEQKSIALTYQEYSILPTATKNNGTSYYIEDSIGVYPNGDVNVKGTITCSQFIIPINPELLLQQKVQFG